ncbi:hypothetical protein LCGC14_0446280 [marine sediment metagenome]|uniref:EH domain-containing protein n=1 Tax=marine sediment metagenome TaxID=412755 RepID=A0A0F9VT68_9ZZZZ
MCRTNRGRAEGFGLPSSSWGWSFGDQPETSSTGYTRLATTVTRGRSLSPDSDLAEPSLVRAALPGSVLRSIWSLGPPALASPISVVSVQARVYSVSFTLIIRDRKTEVNSSSARFLDEFVSRIPPDDEGLFEDTNLVA